MISGGYPSTIPRAHTGSRRGRPTRTALRLRRTVAGWSTRIIGRAQPLWSAATSRTGKERTLPVTRMDFGAPTGKLKLHLLEKGTSAPLTARVSVQQKNGKDFSLR